MLIVFRFLLLLSCLVVSTIPAYAHSAERGFVLLLPTGFIIAAGTAVVALTFVILGFARDETIRNVFSCQRRLFTIHMPRKLFAGFFAVVFCIALYEGLAGSADPLRNLLPLTVWVGFWIVIVLLHPVIGNIWRVINPFELLVRGATSVAARWSGWPALLLFAAFAWFQLVYPAPEDPARLAFVVTTYVVFTVAACYVVGTATWLQHGDPFSIILRALSGMAPLAWSSGGSASLQLPGAGLVSEKAPGLGVTSLIVLALAAISFDALAVTFFWATLWGINPLEFPGRTAMVVPNSIGLILSFAILFSALWFSAWLGQIWSCHAASTLRLFARFTLAMLPISAAFHFSHYLTELLVNGQYLIAAWSTFLGVGSEDAHVTTSFLNTSTGARTIYAAQTLSIVLGHVLSIAIAHAMALDEGLTGRRALKLEAPTAVLMVVYTAFGLWLLSTPTIA